MRYIITEALKTDLRTSSSGSYIDLTSVVAGSAVATVSGGPATGSIQVWVSNDNDPGYGNNAGFKPTNWAPVSSLKVSWTGPGSYVIPTVDLGYGWMKIVYSNAGQSTGSLDVRVKTTGY